MRAECVAASGSSLGKSVALKPQPTLPASLPPLLLLLFPPSSSAPSTLPSFAHLSILSQILFQASIHLTFPFLLSPLYPFLVQWFNSSRSSVPSSFPCLLPLQVTSLCQYSYYTLSPSILATKPSTSLPYLLPLSSPLPIHPSLLLSQLILPLLLFLPSNLLLLHKLNVFQNEKKTTWAGEKPKFPPPPYPSLCIQQLLRNCWMDH